MLPVFNPFINCISQRKKKGLPQQTSDNDSVTRNETSGQLLQKTGKAGDYQPLDLRDSEKHAL